MQSLKAPDGVLLDYKDIISYEIIKDGQVMRRAGESIRADIAQRASSGSDGEPLCSDLQLVIKTKNAAYPEVIMPFISFSIDSEFAYNEALEATNEAAEELERVINRG